jgi:TolB-like protein/class 3 adenylate cyclase/Tfp pilus assembly protein PilF
MSADVAGYSALMAADEEGTLTRLKLHREELVEPVIATHGGRVVKLMGDGLLAEFASVVEAVRAAVEIQRQGPIRNETIGVDDRIVFRIGINQGDVIIDGDDIYGDGVNVAARLQERASPGGICISQPVYGEVRGKLDVGIDDLGDQELKNIPEPVRVYRVLTAPDEVQAGRRRWNFRSRRQRLAAASLSLFLVIAAAALGWYWMSPSEPESSGLAGSVKPTIAVLPFTNLSRDPEEEYFSDGITDDIITDLSKFRDLQVIASNSIRAYKGKDVSVEEVARSLGIRYVLEGSIRRIDDRVRINAQLVDGYSGRHLWADRYDEAIEHIFDLQERITRNIVRALAVRLTAEEQKRVFTSPTDNLTAYDLVMRGRKLRARLKRSDNFEARRMYRKAIELDNNYAEAYAGLGHTHYNAILFGWTGTPGADFQKARDLAQRAIGLDASSAYGQALLGLLYMNERKYDLAVVSLERAIAINPNDAGILGWQGVVLLWSGFPDGAILVMEAARRFDPFLSPDKTAALGLAYYLKGRFDDAAKLLEPMLGYNPDFAYGQQVLAATYGRMGRTEDARRAADEVRRLSPFFSREAFTKHSLFRDSADAALFAEGLRLAGLD